MEVNPTLREYTYTIRWYYQHVMTKKATLTYTTNEDDKNIVIQIEIVNTRYPITFYVFQRPYQEDEKNSNIHKDDRNLNYDHGNDHRFLVWTTIEDALDRILYREVISMNEIRHHMPLYYTICDTNKGMIETIGFIHTKDHLSYMWNTHRGHLMNLHILILEQDYFPKEICKMIIVFYSENILVEYRNVKEFFYPYQNDYSDTITPMIL